MVTDSLQILEKKERERREDLFTLKSKSCILVALNKFS